MDITALSSPSPSLSILLTISLPLHLLPPRLFLFSHSLSLPRCASKVRIASCARIYTVGRVQIYICLNSLLLPPERKKNNKNNNHFTFAVRSILKRPIGFQLPRLNLKANDGDEPLSLHLKKKKHDTSENRGLHMEIII